MTSIYLLHLLTPGYHSQVVFQIKGIQAQHTNLLVGKHHLHWNDEVIKVLKYVKCISLKLNDVMLKLSEEGTPELKHVQD